MEAFSLILLELAFIIGLAAAGRGFALRLKQAAVLGELLVGVVFGNIAYWLGTPLATVVMHLDDAFRLMEEVWMSGVSVHEAAECVFGTEHLEHGSTSHELMALLVGPHASDLLLMTVALWLFSNLGVILLLFMVGLENRVGDMLKVGGRSLAVSLVGIAAPFTLGLLTSMWLLPDISTPAHLFLGATLSATSVGITARVLEDLQRQRSPEARVILGAAVIDDILGLVLLAIVIGIVSSGSIQLQEVSRIIGASLAFIVLVMLYGERIVSWLVQHFYQFFSHMQVRLLFPLALAFLMAALANYIGLAAIVGAFAAGLIVCDEQFGDNPTKSPTTQELIGPLQSLFAPVFFILMGMQVNLQTFLDTDTLWLAVVFSAAAVIGKLVSGLVAGKNIDRLSIGIGMMPRGEVGLIFASIGKGLGVVSDSIFSAIVIMVIVTTLLTPLLLKWSLERAGANAAP
jgi:Kef-type K+ transport system membrane component KefB